MTTNLIIDILTYFAKFPNIEGVKKNFKNTNSSIPGYVELKTSIDNLPEHSLFPEIQDFVFGMDEKVVFEKIQNTKNMFLFLDYGQVNVKVDEQHDITSNGIALALTVAHNYSTQNKDAMEQAVLMNQTLASLTNIITQIKLDDKENRCALTRYFTNPSDIVPVDPNEFFSKLGWTIFFHKKENLF
ncbi:MAG: hypothetical protein JEY96_01515 [Bacteroidales bacterium]|nr:hypothetical protein [Bacteroidales bacterium]